MDGLSRVFGVGPVIEIGGRSLPVRTLRLKSYAEAEAQITFLRGNPFDVVRQVCNTFRNPVRFAEHAVRQIDRKWRTVQFSEVFEWYETFSGRIFALWQCVRHNGVELHWVREKGVERDGSFWNSVETAIYQSSPFGEVAALDELARRQADRDEQSDSSWWSIVRGFAEEFSLTFDDVGDMTLEQMNAMVTDKDNLKEGVKGFDTPAEIQGWINWRNGRINDAAKNLSRGNRWNG